MLSNREKIIKRNNFQYKYLTFFVDRNTELVYPEIHGNGTAQISVEKHDDWFELDLQSRPGRRSGAVSARFLCTHNAVHLLFLCSFKPIS